MSDFAEVQTLFDKIINIKLFNKNGTFDLISIPPTGMKPKISIQGQFVSSQVIGSVDLRITNYFPNKPLDTYDGIEIEAGYKNSLTTQMQASGNVGQIFLAYQESAGPDGVTYFNFITGQFTSWVNATINEHWNNSTINQILSDVAKAAGFNLKSTLTNNQPVTIDFNGNVKDLMEQVLKPNYRFNYRIDGKNLVVWDFNSSSPFIYNIQFFSNPPQVSANGITFTAPWIPTMRPGDQIKVDPRFFRTNVFNGVSIPLPSVLTVGLIDFQFDTVTEQNSMSVWAYTPSTQTA